MKRLDDLIAEIGSGPSGPQVGAFFDFDGTLIDGYSANVFYRSRLRALEISPAELASSLVAGLDMSLRGADVSRLMQIAAAALAGRAEDELVDRGERLFVQRIAGMVYPEARAIVRAHQRMGHTVALASSATRYQAAPLAADLRVEHLLCTRLGVAQGVLTGEIDGPILWGEGKAQAVRDFAAARGVDLAGSYAYGNGDEDLPFLEAVGQPRPLNPQSGLAETARERGWPELRFRSRGRPGITELLRTGAALGALGAATALGAGVGLLNGSRRQAANLAAAAGSEAVLALAGVELRVDGEENVWSQRPAVFLFNHQSSLDMLVLGKLLRRDFTGVAKKEASRDPRFAPLGYLADVAYVERGNTRQAKQTLAPVVERLRQGVSIAISPEGTRTPTPRLAPFKKGAFHMAIQGGVPLVPIVIRNAGELMWRGSSVIRPGTIDVAVLAPIPTDGWKASELNERIAEVRQLYVDKLDQWAGGGADGSAAADRARPARPSGRRAPGPAQARS